MEYIIENVTSEELEKIEASGIEWYPDDMEGSDIAIEGNEREVDRALKIMGRQFDRVSEWVSKDEELPNAYENVEVLLADGRICKEMIIRSALGILIWSNHNDSDIVFWRRME